jgi:hypothetical protein
LPVTRTASPRAGGFESRQRPSDELDGANCPVKSSALGHSHHSDDVLVRSALHPLATTKRTLREVGFVPRPDNGDPNCHCVAEVASRHHGSGDSKRLDVAIPNNQKLTVAKFACPTRPRGNERMLFHVDSMRLPTTWARTDETHCSSQSGGDGQEYSQERTWIPPRFSL